MAWSKDKGTIAKVNADYAKEQGEFAQTEANNVKQFVEDNKTRWLNAVATVAARNSTYPNPQNGDTVRVTSEAKTYRYVSPTGWVVTDIYDATAIDQVAQQLAQSEERLKQKSSIVVDLKKSLSDFAYNVKQQRLIEDNFSRGTGLLRTESGQVWEVTSGSFKIENNHLLGNASATWSKAVVETGYADAEISTIIRSFAGAPRLVFRLKDNLNYWFFGVTSSDVPNNLMLAKVVNGVITQIVGEGWELNSSIGSRFKVVVEGNSVKIYINSYLFKQVKIDDTFLNETKHGVSLYGSGGMLTSFRVNTIEKINYSNNLIASVDNMYVAYDGANLLLSEDGGRSFAKGFSIQGIDIIKYVHLFGDGKILFADHQKVYYSHDWQAYHEANVYDENGSVYVPEALDNFSCYKNGTVKKVVNGTELAVWGNYSTNPQVERSDKIKVWYTKDYGKTIRCCYTLNRPNTAIARHIHAVDFNPYDSSFWLQTGDGVEESHWIKGMYNLTSDTWTWTIFASGLNFKSTNMIFHSNGFVYWSWDKTPGGAVRAPIETMGNIEKHELLFQTNKDCHFLIIGPKGDIAIFQTAWNGTERPRIFYYAPDGVNFTRINGSMPYRFENVNDAQYQTYWGINSQGKVLAGIQSISQQSIGNWDRKPSIFIDDILRENGYPNAFK